MFKVPAVPPRRSAVLTVFRGAMAINDGTTAEPRLSWRCHCDLCRTSTAVAPRLRCDYCCALRDHDETFTGDTNRGYFLAILKLTAQMKHTFHHEANIRPTSLTSLVDELSESHFYGKPMHAGMRPQVGEHCVKDTTEEEGFGNVLFTTKIQHVHKRIAKFRL